MVVSPQAGPGTPQEPGELWDPERRDPGAPGRCALVVLAGGSGTRLGASLNKVYLPLAGRPVIAWSFLWAARVAQIGRLVLVVRAGDEQVAREILDRDLPGPAIDLIPGGSSRHGSERAALDVLRPSIDDREIDVVAIHDGARPLAGPSLIRSVVTTAATVGGAVPVLGAPTLLPVDAHGELAVRADPEVRDARGGRRPVRGPVRVQTPQAFGAAELLAVYDAAAGVGFEGTDTASSVETFSRMPVRAVPGSPYNLKVTYAHDLLIAERFLAAHRYRLP